MHYYKHHIGDYRRDTAHLSLLEHGIYRQLLDWYYLDETPIPNETQAVYRRLSARNDAERQAIDLVLNDFFKKTPKGWVNSRCNIELGKYQQNTDKNKANGKLGGRPKKTQSVILENPNDSQNNLNHKPLTINQEESKALAPLPKTKPRSRRAPPEFWPTEPMQAWAKVRAPGIDIDRETEKFRNHEFKDPKSDWNATWKNWILSAYERQRPTGRQQSTRSMADLAAEKINNILARNQGSNDER